MNQRPDFVEAQREMKKTAWRTCERDFRRKHTHSSSTTIKTAKEPPIWRTWRVYLSNRRPNRMENLSFEVTGKLVAESNTFVLVKSMGGWSEVEQKLEFLAILILDWTGVTSQFRDAFFFVACRESEFPGNRRGCGQVHLPHATFTHVQSLHRTHSTDMCTMAEGAGRRKGFLCAHIGPSSTRHVCSFVARDTEHFLTFSFFYLSCVVVVFFSEPRPVVHVSNYPLRRSIAGWHFYGIHLLHRFWAQRDRAQQDSGQTTKSKILTTRMVIEEPCVKKLSYSLSVYDSAESIATPPDSDLEDEQLRKLLASPLHRREREENEGQATSLSPWTRKLDGPVFSESWSIRENWCGVCTEARENEQRTQAYHSRRESLMASSSRELEVSGKTEVTNRETDKFADQANVGNLFLIETRIICLIKQGLNLWSRNIKWDLLTVVSMNFSNMLILIDWNWRTPITFFWISKRTTTPARRINYEGKALRETQTRKTHEMGEMKRAQEFRVDEFSVQKLRETHETIQRLTSQMQEMQEQMNSMNDSGECSEVESNHSWRLS